MTSDVETIGRPSFWSSLYQRLTAAVPPFRVALMGAVLWAIAIGVSVYAGLNWRSWEIARQREAISLLFAVSGFLSFPIGLYGARLIANGKSTAWRFVIALIVFAVITVGITSLCYAVNYRQYYSQWHDHEFSKLFVIQLIFTAAAALYQFAVLGIRLYFPFGVVALIVASLWFARQAD